MLMINFAPNFVAGPFWVRGGKVGATLMEVADHIDHVKALIGVDYIGIGIALLCLIRRAVVRFSSHFLALGADYDGIKDTSRGLEDVSMVPYLTAELLER